jgi:hypothetical protein
MNAFVHVSYPDEILVELEEAKVNCRDCDKSYIGKEINDVDRKIHIAKNVPEDGFCQNVISYLKLVWIITFGIWTKSIEIRGRSQHIQGKERSNSWIL